MRATTTTTLGHARTGGMHRVIAVAPGAAEILVRDGGTQAAMGRGYA